MQRGARGRTRDDALRSRELARRRESVRVADRDDLIDDCSIEHLREETHSDTRDAVFPWDLARQHGCARRLNRDNAERRLALLERLADPGEGPAGTKGGDDDIDR